MSTAERPRRSPSVKTFIARQPIFDRQGEVFAYELLFRSGTENSYDGSRPEMATSRVIVDNLLMMDLESLLGGKPAFINATREALVQDHMTILPPEKTVVEIVETIPPTRDVMDACSRLKAAGYRIALDDFSDSPDSRLFLPSADFVKVDFLASDAEAQARMMKTYGRAARAFVAEKLETPESFRTASELGYRYFQGYFFSRPAILTGQRLAGSRARYLDLLKEFSRVELSFDRLEEILRRDVSISYRLLRYINSAHFGLRYKVASLKQALLLLGEIELRKWLSVIALAALLEDKPDELFVHSIIRARFCESLAAASGMVGREPACFIMGMFSLLDALMDRPLPEILVEIPVEDEIRNALLGQENVLNRVLSCALAYERGDWEEYLSRCGHLGFDPDFSADLYLDAVAWGQDSLVARRE